MGTLNPNGIDGKFNILWKHDHLFQIGLRKYNSDKLDDLGAVPDPQLQTDPTPAQTDVFQCHSPGLEYLPGIQNQLSESYRLRR